MRITLENIVKSLRYDGAGAVTVVDVPDPQPDGDQVLIRVEASAVCGSERSPLAKGSPGNGGHEACGVIADPGDSRFNVGDRVGLSAVVGCGQCEACQAGRQLHCRSWRGSSDQGWHAELVAVHKDALYRVPDGIDATLGVLLTGDSLGVPVRGLHRAPSYPGEQVVVIGLGPVGLGHVLVRAYTGSRVVAIEPSADRRRLALQLGAVEVLPVESEINVRPRVVIECTGRPDCIARAFELVDNGGVVLQSGECGQEIPINPSATIIRREITYTGSWYFANEDYDEMKRLVSSGLPLIQMMTHEADFGDAQGAITDFLAGRSGKVVLRWDRK